MKITTLHSFPEFISLLKKIDATRRNAVSRYAISIIRLPFSQFPFAISDSLFSSNFSSISLRIFRTIHRFAKRQQVFIESNAFVLRKYAYNAGKGRTTKEEEDSVGAEVVNEIRTFACGWRCRRSFSNYRREMNYARDEDGWLNGGSARVSDLNRVRLHWLK